MKKLTKEKQALILRKHLRAFIKAQTKATKALQQINTIVFCENDGNPLEAALQGTSEVCNFAGEIDPKLLNELFRETLSAHNNSDYWTSF